MDANAGDLSRAGVAAVGAGLVGGVALALVVRLLWEFPLTAWFGYLVVAILLMATGAPVGETIRRAARRSMDTRIRYMAAFGVLIVYTVAILVAQALNVPGNLFLHLFTLIGLGMGMWTAMNRVRP